MLRLRSGPLPKSHPGRVDPRASRARGILRALASPWTNPPNGQRGTCWRKQARGAPGRAHLLPSPPLLLCCHEAAASPRHPVPRTSATESVPTGGSAHGKLVPGVCHRDERPMGTAGLASREATQPPRRQRSFPKRLTARRPGHRRGPDQQWPSHGVPQTLRRRVPGEGGEV